VQGLSHRAVYLRLGPVARARAVADVFADGEADQLIVGILEHDAHEISDAADCRRRHGRAANRDAADEAVRCALPARFVHVQVAAPLGQQSGEVQQQRGLARALGPMRPTRSPAATLSVTPSRAGDPSVG